MQRVALRDVDLASFKTSVGADGFADGTAAVKRGAIVQMAWEASQQLLTGTVKDGGGEIRTVSASFRASNGFPLRFRRGYCSCAVGTDCVHVAALVLAATDETLLPASAQAGGTARRSTLPWEQSLDSLLGTPQGNSAPPADETPAIAPLAVELSLVQNSTENSRYPSYSTHVRQQQLADDATRKLKLQARLVQPGRVGGWVAGNLSWSRLDYMLLRDEFPPAHVRLLHELFALYRASTTQQGYYTSYSYGGYGGDQKYLDLSSCESHQLWPVLDQAHELGLPFVYRGKQGTVPPPGTAELTLDVTSDETTLLIAPVIKTSDGADAVPLRFIGSEGHGVIYTDRGQANHGELARFRLARLAHPVPAQLQHLALVDERLVVPESGQAAFLSKYYPRLRRMAAVTSSDGSFTAPEISDPALVVRAAYARGHRVEVRWEWAYQVGGTELRAGLGSAPDPFRDSQAEARVFARPRSARRLAGGSPRTRPGSYRTDPFLRLHPQWSRHDDLHHRGAAAAVGPRRRAPRGDRAGTRLPRGRGLAGDRGVGRRARRRPRLVRPRHRHHRRGPQGAVHRAVRRAGERPVAPAAGGRRVLLARQARARGPRPAHRRGADAAGPAGRRAADQPVPGRAVGGAGRPGRGQPPGGGVAAAGARAAGRRGDRRPRRSRPSVCAQLRPYQLSGFQWLAFLWTNGLGGILADDMGLGKTLQTLALIQHAKDVRGPEPPGTGSSRPFLIVAPTSVLANWATEAERFAPDLKVVTVSDTLGRRGVSLSGVIDGADAVVTSYTLLRLDFEAYGAAEWAGLFLDEAQYVKNHQSKAYQCARRLATPFKVAITGTPMENNLMELWSLLSITAPGLFPNPERFKDYYARPIEKGGNAELLAQLRRRIRPLIMRRTKEQVAADLPEKQEQVLEVELHPRHRKVYQTHLQRERQKVLGLLDDVNHNRFTILRSLTLLRQLSLHAALVDEEHSDVPSAKIDSLIEQIEDVVGGGHRALVFSQFTRFLRMARSRLEAAGVECCYLDGTTTNRPAVISSFKEGTAPVFLISLKAGGFGLNLTEADYCFLLDPWWNPATEAQAVDRTHRIGQTRNVMVYRLIASGTIEEKVMALKARKQELFSSVIDSDGAFSSALSADDIRALFA